MPLPRPLNPTRGSITYTDSVELGNGFRIDFAITSAADGADWASGSVRLVLVDDDLVDDDDEVVAFNLGSVRIPFNEASTVDDAFDKLAAIGDVVVDVIVPNLAPPS